jgi:hypothetical protein
MPIYVKFNEAGHSVEMTNINPDSSDFIELADEMMGKHLKKVGKKVIELTDEEVEDKFLKARIAAETISANNKAKLLLTESESLALPDAWDSYTKIQKSKVTSYRDYLRNIEKQKGFPLDLEWPELPNLKE